LKETICGYIRFHDALEKTKRRRKKQNKRGIKSLKLPELLTDRAEA
jgi:hypothetical protein